MDEVKEAKIKEMIHDIYDFIGDNKSCVDAVWEEEDRRIISEVECIVEDDIYELWKMIETLEEYIFPNG